MTLKGQFLNEKRKERHTMKYTTPKASETYRRFTMPPLLSNNHRWSKSTACFSEESEEEPEAIQLNENKCMEIYEYIELIQIE